MSPSSATLDLSAERAAAALETGLPVALLPVRLETRFVQESSVWYLLVRVFPDDIHINDHHEELSETDKSARALYRDMRSNPSQGPEAAWRELCRRVGPWRAAWLARDDLPTTASSSSPRATLLPARFVLVRSYAAPIAPMSTSLEPIPGDLPIAPPLGDSAQSWLADLGEAVRVGMAAKIKLEGDALAGGAPRKIDRLTVIGVPRCDTGGLGALLDAHRYAHGLRLLAPGTPTNNTAEAAAAWGSPDLEDLRKKLTEAAPNTSSDGGLLAAALGLDARVLAGLPGATARELAAAADMVELLWPVTWEPFLRHALQLNTTELRAAWNKLRVHATAHLRALGPLPALCVGRQPYGVLPVVPLYPRVAPASFEQKVEAVLDKLRPTWETAAKLVKRLDPSAGDDMGGETQEGVLAEVMAQQPWPMAAVVRKLSDTALSAAEYAARTSTYGALLPSGQAVPSQASGKLAIAGRAWSEKPTTWSKALTGDSSLLAALLAEPREDAVQANAEDQPRTPESILKSLSTLPRDKLDRLFLATLATADHRLDAWMTSLATARLATLRRSKATGLYIGAYGWVENLSPRKSGSSNGDGYMLAPSLAHATTAAILRSGANVYNDQAQGATFAIDLSSARARVAREVLGAVRSGVPLAAVLGRMIERLLHDAGLSYVIAPLRSAVSAAVRAALKADGKTAFRFNRLAGGVVDGVLVCRALLDAADDQSAVEVAVSSALGKLAISGKGTQSLYKHLGEGDEVTGKAVLQPALDALDAVADAGLFEAVHALAAGRHEAASAILGAVDRGENPPPELSSLDTPRGGILVRQRVILAVGPVPKGPSVGWPRAASALSALAEPRLEAFARAVLPRPDRVAYEVVWRDSDGREIACPARLSEAGLCALELCRLAALAARLDGSALATTLLGAAARKRPFEVHDDAVPVAVVSEIEPPADGCDLSEALAVAGTLGRIFGAARALEPADLPRASGGSAVGTAALLGRLDAVLDAVEPARLSALRERRQALTAASAPAAIVAALREAVGWDVPVLPPFRLLTPTNATDDEWDRASRQPAASGAVVHRWIAQCGKVRSDVETLASLCRLVDTLGGGAVFKARGVQIRANPNKAEAWAAVSAPARSTDTLAVVSLGQPSLSADVAGLLVDAWSDRIPATHANAAITVHWNAPAARAPAAILLAVPPEPDAVETGKWTLGKLQACVDQAALLARIRPVGPEHLSGIGQLLPALLLSKDPKPGGTVLALSGAAYAASADPADVSS